MDAEILENLPMQTSNVNSNHHVGIDVEKLACILPGFNVFAGSLTPCNH